jgi:alkylation response protein AidB-like acyl-CoA dehydrogenase
LLLHDRAGQPGSNPTWLSTTATKDGDDYLVSGHKWFSTGADGAAFAIVMAVTDPTASRYQRASMILVPADTPGFHIVRNTSVMGERGQGWASHAEIRYDDCRVPQSNRLGAEGMGFVIAQQRLLAPGASTTACAGSASASGRSEMCRHANLRHIAPGAAGRDGSGADGWLRAAEIDVARLLVLQTAGRRPRRGTPPATAFR